MTRNFEVSGWLVASLVLSLALGSSLQAQSGVDLTFGGSGTDTILAMEKGEEGFWVVGVTDSPDFPVTDGSLPAGGEDLFVARLAMDGTLIAATRWGGTGDDRATGLVITEDGRITVAGWTTSTDCPLVQPFQENSGGKSDALILQYTSELTLEWATYYGGSGDDQFSGVTYETNTQGLIFVGFTTSLDFPFPTPNGSNVDVSKSSDQDTDGLLVAINLDRTLRLATYHGLNGSNEIILAVAADPQGFVSSEAGEVAITGWTDHSQFYGISFDPRGSGRKMFAGLLSSVRGARLMSRVRGGNGADEGLAVGYSQGVLLVGGRTSSTDFLVSANGTQSIHGGGNWDGFVVGYRQDDFVSWGSYVGGSGDDQIRGVAVDPNGQFHLVGTTSSMDILQGLTMELNSDSNGYQGGHSDGFLMRLDLKQSDPFGIPNLEGRIQSWEYAGGAGEEGFLAANYLEISGTNGNPDSYQSMGAGGRLVEVSQSLSVLKKRNLIKQSGLNEQAWIYSPGQRKGKADVSIQMRFKEFIGLGVLPREVPLTMEVEIANHGPEATEGILIPFFAEIPDGVEVLDTDVVWAPETTIFSFPPTIEDGQVKGVVRLAPEQSLDISIRVKVLQDAPDPLVFHGSVSSGFEDPVPGNNQYQNEYAGRFLNDLRITTDSFIPRRAGEKSLLLFTVYNDGPGGTASGKVSVQVLGAVAVEEIGFFDQGNLVHSGSLFEGGAKAELGIELLGVKESRSFGLKLIALNPGQATLVAAIHPSEPGSDPLLSNNILDRSASIGSAASASVRGVVYQDNDRNLFFGQGDTVVSGAVVTILDRTRTSQTTRSNSQGLYQFGGLEPGEMALGVVPPEGSEAPFIFGGDPSSWIIKVETGEDRINLDLPVFPLESTPVQPFQIFPFRLSQEDGNGLPFLFWHGNAQVESAPSVNGPFEVIPGAVSPFPIINPPEGEQGPVIYFRLVKPANP